MLTFFEHKQKILRLHSVISHLIFNNKHYFFTAVSHFLLKIYFLLKFATFNICGAQLSFTIKTS